MPNAGIGAMQERLTVAQVLARFDREVGLEATPRASAVVAATVGSAPASEASPPREASPDHVRVHAPSQAPGRGAARAVHAFPPASLSAPRDAADRLARLSEIEARHAAGCPHCTVASGHARLVFGEGAPDAELMFVGEAPGETEDRLGRPFVGAAGEKLDEMVRAMGLRREDVYVANVLKARPPGDRTPMPDEVAACGPFLAEQILAVRPRAIVTLGGPATKFVCGVEAGISRLRGTWQSWMPPVGADCEPIPVMPTYHPAYVLRTYTKQVRAEVWSDLRAALAKIGRRPPERPAAPEA